MRENALWIILLGLVSFAGISIHQAFQIDSLPQIIKAPDLDQPFNFAGEAIPRANQDVIDRLDRELITNAYLHGSTILNIKLAARHFPLIEKILHEKGIPIDFKYLVPVESNFTNATSPSGAKGFWQFMAPTARALGLEVNDKVDERFHLEKATYAACAHIKDLYRQFGSWTLAAAAYNGGGERISRELKAQKVDNFYDLYLNSETSKYVFRILAIKAILNDPQKYGFDLDNKNLYKPLQNIHQIQIDTSINDLPAFARSQGTTYRMLRYLNPWLIDRSLPVKGKSYTLNIPDK